MLKGASGVVVTPLGNPLTFTVTVPVNPSTAVAATVAGPLVVPCAVRIEDGNTEKLKSGVSTMFKVRLAECANDPLVP
jgi:hypothetical protein